MRHYIVAQDALKTNSINYEYNKISNVDVKKNGNENYFCKTSTHSINPAAEGEKSYFNEKTYYENRLMYICYKHIVTPMKLLDI